MSSAGKPFGITAAVLLLAATALGAYASHGLAALEPRALAAVETAISYQFYHGLALLVVAALDGRIGATATRVTGALLLAGMLLFCGGIYLTHLLGLAAASRVTPFGGLLLMAAWLALVAALARARLRAP